MKIHLGGIGEAFADRNFRIHTVGSIASWLSFFIQEVAVSWTAWELTHSTTWLAIIALIEIVPNILILPWGGILADRVDRFWINLATAVLALFQALALTVLATSGALTVWWLAILVALQGTIHGFSIPAQFGMLPRFIARSRLSAAIAVNAAYTQFAIFAGPAVAGWLIHGFGAATAFASNIVGYAIYIATVLCLKTPPDFQPPVPSGRPVHQDLWDGVRYILGHRGIRTLLLLALVGDAMGNGIYEMLPAYADQVLGRGVGGMSALMTAGGLGATCAALWLAHRGSKAVSPERVLWAFLGYTIAIAWLVLVDQFILALAAMVAFGIAGEIRRTGTVTLLQLSIEESQRGRVMATRFLLLRAAAGIGTLLVGTTAEHYGLRLPILVAVGLSLLAWALTFRRRQAMVEAFAVPAAQAAGS
ncbi:MAG TPA: MFS transporter [Dongiaceae bacterium]|nr:MFS transporter [Dongiaceae bacterium]